MAKCYSPHAAACGPSPSPQALGRFGPQSPETGLCKLGPAPRGAAVGASTTVLPKTADTKPSGTKSAAGMMQKLRHTVTQFLASQTDKEGNSFSYRQIAKGVGADEATIRRDLSKVSTAANAGVDRGTTVPPKTANTKPSRTRGKDRKVRAAKASKEVITKAWALHWPTSW